MKTIFLIDGAAGTGKSDMVNYLTTKKRNHATLIPKFTTRKQRRTEKNTKLDLNFPEDSKDQFLERTKDEDFYWYTYGNKELGEEYYGFYKENISEALKHFAFVLIIVRDHETILEIKRDYNYVQVISVFIYTDKDLIVERLKKDKCTPKEIDDRQDRQPLAWYDYLKHSSSYDELIINSSKNVFAPGAAFGAYSASKAGAHQLGKIAALELAEIGVRVNMINADAIFNDQDVSSGLWDVVGPDRMKSRNLDPEGLKEYYRQRNLLKTEVVADHVGNGVVFFASGLTPTTGATLPVDGGVEGAFPR